MTSTRPGVAVCCLIGLAIAAATQLSTGRAQDKDSVNRKAWLAVAPGRVEPASGEIRIGSQAVARVEQVLVSVNDRVFAGEALLRLVDEDVRLRHAKAEAQVALHRRARTGTVQGKAAERRKLEDSVADAERALTQAQGSVDAAALARRDGSGSEEALAKAREALSQARERVRERRADLAKFDNDVQVAASDLDSQITLARIELRGAEAALDNLVIRSPIAGTVLQVNVRAGELATPSSTEPLVVIGDITSLRVRAEIDERDFGLVRVGHPVVVRSAAFPGRDVAGKVALIAPLIQPGRVSRGQRTVTDVHVAEAVIDLAEPGPLAVGMKVDVYFTREGAQR